ncbi:UDP-N-acetylglucosamine 2-epimerase (non-hydrolyzing) [Methanofollis sp. W23]|uniref:non-hydrolyzing UDP-N-acetylglucosamine 2-epimerase n=1 Tax=Methanofollis sp. W23 TaxID=2817849 RepID=UPI001AE4EA2D|nr:UDP-N-acetylglucosamine 2-epimerase (non-hydrolyzing) [Methanofollis sp. W23]MBP2144654.1 UDP-N-acetylglucosamine 2-epimerase (non-hydrolyzing) [Methanofollis sp. W23]
MKILTVVGARPQFIKCAPVSRALRKEHEEVLVHTGQHYDREMSDLFFEELGIPRPDHNLGIGSGTHGHQTGAMLAGIEDLILQEEPDCVLVYGDTNSTLAGALAAAKLHVPVAHVEAGLRSFDRRMPEEINRVLTDHCSDLLLAPTRTAVENLASEGITRGVHLTGDVMVDALLDHAEQARRSSFLDDLGLTAGEYRLATVHRAENTDDPEKLTAIVRALTEIGNIVLPCHPRTEKMLKSFWLWEEANEGIRIISPVGYLEMLALEAGAAQILTDSGGVQKEAYVLGVPCITMRESTEWVETVQDGWNVLVGSDYGAIVRAAREFVPEKERSDVFGKGDAAAVIARVIREMEI